MCYNKGSLFQLEFIFCYRGKKCIRMSSDWMMGREEKVSALVAFWHCFLCFTLLSPFSLVYSIKWGRGGLKQEVEN